MLNIDGKRMKKNIKLLKKNIFIVEEICYGDLIYYVLKEVHCIQVQCNVHVVCIMHCYLQCMLLLCLHIQLNLLFIVSLIVILIVIFCYQCTGAMYIVNSCLLFSVENKFMYKEKYIRNSCLSSLRYFCILSTNSQHKLKENSQGKCVEVVEGKGETDYHCFFGEGGREESATLYKKYIYIFTKEKFPLKPKAKLFVE